MCINHVQFSGIREQDNIPLRKKKQNVEAPIKSAGLGTVFSPSNVETKNELVRGESNHSDQSVMDSEYKIVLSQGLRIGNKIHGHKSSPKVPSAFPLLENLGICFLRNTLGNYAPQNTLHDYDIKEWSMKRSFYLEALGTVLASIVVTILKG